MPTISSRWASLPVATGITPVTNGQQIDGTNTGRAGAAAVIGLANFSPTLTTTAGTQNISTTQTIRNRNFTGVVNVTGGTVTFEFCTFTYATSASDTQLNGSGGNIQANWCDFLAGNTAASDGRNIESTGAGRTTSLYRCHLSGAANGITLTQYASAATSTILETLIDGLTYNSGSHTDAIELYTADNILVQRCRLMMQLNGVTSQSCINVTTDFGNSSGNPVTIDACYIAGGISPCLTRFHAQDSGTQILRVAYTNNYFSDNCYYGRLCDFDGMNATFNTQYASQNPAVILWSNNLWAPNGEGVTNPATAPSGDVPLLRPHTPGQVIGADFYGGEIFSWATSGGAVVGPPAGATVPIAAPSGLTATPGNTSSSITFTGISAGNNGGSAVTAYRATAYISGVSQGITGSSATSPVTVNGLTNGSTYTFTIAAQNILGFGPESVQSNSSTPFSAGTVPGAPTSAAASSAGSGQVSVSWTIPVSNGGATITHYTATSVTPNTSSSATVVGATATSVIVGGLTNGTAYTFNVVATNGIGNSLPSNTTNSVTPTTATSISARPNDGSGFWADFFTTGFTHAPGYGGSIADQQAGMTATGTITFAPGAGAVTTGKRFLAGTINMTSDNMIFNGCLFEGTNPNGLFVRLQMATKVTFNYCTFRPFNVGATNPSDLLQKYPPGNNGAVTCSVTSPGTPYTSSWEYINQDAGALAGTTGGLFMDHCDVWGNAGIQGVPTGSKWTYCYIHDAADNNSSGGSGYHHDGIGPQSSGNNDNLTIDHCVIASLGNTNAIAFQGSGTYTNMTITNNYITGYGSSCTDPWGLAFPNPGTGVMQDNVFSGEAGMAGVIRNNGPNQPCIPTAVGTWRRNKWSSRAGDIGSVATSNNGLFVFPTDGSGGNLFPAHASDYTG